MPVPCSFTRRTFVRLLGAAGLVARTHPAPVAAGPSTPAYSYPMGLPGRPLGDGLLVRHGYATENTWYNPGWLHTGEDWYLAEGETGGMAVYAAAAGEVVFAGSEYPGLVVIIEHPDGLYSMYGHLDSALAVAVGQSVERGQVLGAILTRTDGLAPSHLHFEARTFFTTPAVNGNAPRYGVACGFECPPGPGYWPLDAPEHPSLLGWRNPTHLIGGHTELAHGSEAVVAMTATGEVDLWSAPQPDDGAERVGNLRMRPGDRYGLLAIDVGPAASLATSSEGYRVWYQIALPAGDQVWVQAVIPAPIDTGSDGRPSSVRFRLLPAITAVSLE